METEFTEFETGAKRGTDHADCDISLIPPEAVRACGRAFVEGAKKYGRDNWLKGFPQMGIINHALQHIFSYLDGDTSEEHLGHAMWNIGVAIHQAKHRPDLMDLPPYRKVSEDEQDKADKLAFFEIILQGFADHCGLTKCETMNLIRQDVPNFKETFTESPKPSANSQPTATSA